MACCGMPRAAQFVMAVCLKSCGVRFSICAAFLARSKAVRILLIGRPARVKTRLEMFINRFCSCRSSAKTAFRFRDRHVSLGLFLYIAGWHPDKSRLFINEGPRQPYHFINRMAVSKSPIKIRCAGLFIFLNKSWYSASDATRSRFRFFSDLIKLAFFRFDVKRGDSSRISSSTAKLSKHRRNSIPDSRSRMIPARAYHPW